MDATGSHLLVANYRSGTLGVLPILPNGRLTEATHRVQHRGAGVNPDRQEGPHAHSITLDPSNRFALGCDLGIDKVMGYRFDAEDGRWLRRRTHARARTGKFNPGQKLNASFLVAAGIMLLATGVIMRWPDRWSDDLRTGATFMHDWFAIGVLLAIIGHIVFALRDPDALGGMLRGRVPARWARREHPRWYEEVTGKPADKLAASASSGRSAR